MTILAFKKSRAAAAVTLLTLASFLATLLPPRTSRAAASDPIAAGTGGPPDISMPAPTPESPEAESAVDLPTGAATTTYPFRLNKARGSAQPMLGLRYNSSSSLGFAGMGWTLNTPSIVRRGHSGIPRFLDPQFAGFTDPNADDYAIDGSLLVPVAVLNANGTVKSGTVQAGEQFPMLPTNGLSVTWIYYRREVDDGWRYFFDGFTWYVQTKEGHVLQFGVPADQKLGTPVSFAGPSVEFADLATVEDLTLPAGNVNPLNAIYRWNLVRETDATGANTVYYVWDDEQTLYAPGGSKTAGTMFLTDIYDTLAPGQAVQASSFAHHVHVTWNLAFSAGTVGVPYANSPIWRAPPFAELLSVQVFSATSSSTSRQLVREYGMNYVMNDVGTRAFLHSIQVTGDCDGETAGAGLAEGSSTASCATLPPTTFTYTMQPTTTTPTVLKKTLGIFSPALDEGGTTAIASGFADVNGDGRADYTYTTNTATRQIKVQLGGTILPQVMTYHEGADLAAPALRPILGDWASSASTSDSAPRITALVGTAGLSNMIFASGSLGTGATWVWDTVAGGGPDVARSAVAVPVAQSSTLMLSNQTLSANPFDIDGDGLPDHWWQPSPPNGPWVVNFSARDRTGLTTPFAQQGNNGALISFYDPDNPIYSPTLGAPPNGGFGATRAITDLDGDGVSDLAIANFDFVSSVVDIYAMPGHGDGRFGLWNSTTPAAKPYIAVASAFLVAPFNASPSTVAFGDLNGDGFADYAVLTSGGLVICRRITGSWDAAAYQCMTDTDSTFKATAAARIAIADVDGSGIGQVIYNPNDGVTSMTAVAISPNFTTGGVRNGLLQSITNGLGGTTTFAYTLQTGLPVPTWVVQSMTATNGLAAVDSTQSIAATTNYNYGNQPIYDPRDRQFVGFRSVTKFTEGPSGAVNPSAPGAQVVTTFATDTCASYLGTSNLSGTATLCLVGTPDYSLFRAIRALPAVEESSSLTSTAKFKTLVYDYTFQKPYVGLDGGRHVISLASKRTHMYLWDSTQAGVALNADVVDASNGFPPVVANAGGSPCTTGSSGCRMPSNPSIGVPQSGSMLLTQESYDSNGNETSVVDFGRPSVGGDTPIETAYAYELIPDASFWNWRASSRSKGYAARANSTTTNIYGPIAMAFAGGQVVRERDYAYDGVGNLTKVSATLSGTPVLPGPPGQTRQSPPPQEGTLGTGAGVTVTLEGYTYDGYGNVSGTFDNRNPCKSLIAYDATYQQLATSISVNPNVPAACPINPIGTGILTTMLNMDRRLEALKLSVSPAGGMSKTTYDDFGRPTEEDVPFPTASMTSVVASRTDYQDTSPIRRVHTLTPDPNSADVSPNLVVDHYKYIDGLGHVRAAIDAADSRSAGTEWVLSGVRENYPTGPVSAVIKASASSKPSSLASGALPTLPRSPAATFAYDGLNRVVTATDYNGHMSTDTYNTPLLYVDHRDAEQVSGSHQGSYKRTQRDGHDRIVSTDQHLVVGPTGKTGDNTYSYTYLGTGEVTSISETATNTPNLPTRSMTYDSLGRMVTNQDPNSGTRTYAYNVDGSLVGTSDGRGCGENIYYDAIGRIVARDYLPCVAAGDGVLGIYNGICAQAAYTQPTLGSNGLPTGDGTEAYYVYDSGGRLQTKSDRTRQDTYQFDLRDRLVSRTTMLAGVYEAFYLPVTLAGRYIAPVLTESYAYGATNRVLSTAIPVPTNGTGSWAKPSESDSYTYGGRLASATSSFGNILTGQFYNPSGTINNQTFGDASSISASFGYDNDDGLTSYTLSRPKTGPWATVVPAAPDSTTLEQSLSALTITPDKVGNPVTVADGASAGWPSGAAAVSQLKYTYYDDYRLATGTKPTTNQDAFVSPYQNEESQGIVFYPKANVPSTSHRFQNQGFAYTDRGNVTTSTDDATDMPDRSLGAVATSTTSDEIVSGPNGMKVAYDAAGEMTSLNYGTGKYSYKYCWDETGRLAFGGRYNPSGGLDINYGENGYDDRGNRVFKTTNDFGALGGTHFWINLFDDVVIKHPVILGYGTPTATWQYDASQAQLYLAGRKAHVFNSGSNLPMVGSNSTHMFMNFRDRKGSTVLVVDHDSGEVVERTAYQPYGAPDADYRPARWQAFREDLKYDGHWDDAEVGVVNFGGRFYSPQLGRFISPDPLALHGPAGPAVVNALMGRELGLLGGGAGAASFASLRQLGAGRPASPLNDGTAYSDPRIDLATPYGYCSGNPAACMDGNGLWNVYGGVTGSADANGGVQGSAGGWFGSAGVGDYASAGIVGGVGAYAGAGVEFGIGTAPSPAGPSTEIQIDIPEISIAVDKSTTSWDVSITVSIGPAAGFFVGMAQNKTAVTSAPDDDEAQPDEAQPDDQVDDETSPDASTEQPDATVPAAEPQTAPPEAPEENSDPACQCSDDPNGGGGSNQDDSNTGGGGSSNQSGGDDMSSGGGSSSSNGDGQ